MGGYKLTPPRTSLPVLYRLIWGGASISPSTKFAALHHLQPRAAWMLLAGFGTTPERKWCVVVHNCGLTYLNGAYVRHRLTIYSNHEQRNKGSVILEPLRAAFWHLFS